MFINSLHQSADEALKAGKAEEAVDLYTQALNLNPDHPDILSDRGVAFLHLKNRTRCFEDMNRSLELQPLNAYRYASLAYAKNFFGDLDGAITDYEKAVELDPEDAIAYNNLGLLLEQKGYIKEANQRFERADKLSQLEDDLLHVMDELETSDPEPEISLEKNDEIPPIIEAAADKEKEPENNGRTEAKRIFTSRAQFREFLRFIKNGFRLK